MTDLTNRVAKLRRPHLLVRAARMGVHDYRRERDLRRLTGASHTPSPSAAVKSLLETEAGLEAIRTAGDASYSIARHIDILIALMVEVRALTHAR